MRLDAEHVALMDLPEIPEPEIPMTLEPRKTPLPRFDAWHASAERSMILFVREALRAGHRYEDIEIERHEQPAEDGRLFTVTLRTPAVSPKPCSLCGYEGRDIGEHFHRAIEARRKQADDDGNQAEYFLHWRHVEALRSLLPLSHETERDREAE